MKKLIEAIAKLSMSMESMEEEAKEKFNLKELTLTQMNYLEMISQLENPNFTVLALHMGLSKPTITVAVEKLIKRNFISKVKSVTDKRNSRLYLTEKGQLINEMHDYAHRMMAKLISKKLNKDEIDFLVQIFNRVMG
jgi:DNA-binding MarR family transcriptional regulator